MDFTILDGLKNIDMLENMLNKDPDCDKEETKYIIRHYIKIVEGASKNFDNFIKERVAHGWR